MDKKKDNPEKETEETEQSDLTNEQEETPGFPKDVDLKRFLGCGG